MTAQRQLTPQEQQDLALADMKRQVIASIRERQARGELPPDPREALEMAGQMAAQASAEQELLAYAAQLQPDHVQYLARLESSGGPEAVWSALQATGLSSNALQVFTTTYREAGSLQGVAQRVEGRLAEVATANQEQLVQESIARATPKEGDSPERVAFLGRSIAAGILRDPERQRSLAEMYRAKGLVPEPGKTALEDSLFKLGLLGVDSDDGLLLNQTRKIGIEPAIDEAEQVKAFAELIGEPVKVAQELVDSFGYARTHDGLMARLGKRDAELRESHPVPKSTPEEIARDRSQRSLRSALERKADELGLGVEEGPAAKRPTPPVRESPASESAGAEPRSTPTVGPEVSNMRADLEAEWDRQHPAEETTA